MYGRCDACGAPSQVWLERDDGSAWETCAHDFVEVFGQHVRDTGHEIVEDRRAELIRKPEVVA